MSSETLYPLLFQPVYQDYLWGGNRLARQFGRSGTPPVCAESWELSDRPEGMSMVSNGSLKGQTLHTLVETFGPALTGEGATFPVFPLLIKLIDANQDLSLQVHPDTQSAPRVGGEAKTEMWYILDAKPSSVIYAGLNPGVTRERFEQALAADPPDMGVLARVPARPGRVVFVPGGRPHAIGAGCLLLEVQQNSNTTYRIHDWNRTDARGNPRPLHREQAMAVINWEQAAPQVNSPRLLAQTGMNAQAELVHCPFFDVRRLTLHDAETIRHDGHSFHVVFVVNGKLLIGANGMVTVAEAGTTCLIPADARPYTLTPVGGPATAIRITR